MDHVIDGPDGAIGCDVGGEPDSAASRSRRSRAGRAAAAGQVRRLRLVEQRSAAGAARPGRGGAGRRPADRLGRAARRAARVPGRLLGRAPTSRSTATPSCSRRSASRCSTCCRRARAPRSRPIPAKGLTGPGYDGHTFWDAETFVLPVLTYTSPTAAADALRWRHSTLPRRDERAAQLGLPGAAFPWRTIHGEECSGYWPAGTAAFHVNADIADAVVRYVRRDRGRRRSSARSGSSCWSRPRGCGARSATTTRTAASASTASPARTSTARSSTTTSTPT